MEHDLTPGALVTYFMTSPEGDKHHGWWRIGTVDAPRELTIEDGFGDADGQPLTDRTGQLRMRLFEHEGGTRMELHDQFPTLEQMEEMLNDGHGGGPAPGRRANGRPALDPMDAGVGVQRLTPPCPNSRATSWTSASTYRNIAQPFYWTFTRDDLAPVLDKIADRQPSLQLAA